jgi:hypothetical protein
MGSFKLTVISHFLNHHDRVQEQLNRWKSIQNEILDKVEFLIIDDCSDAIPDLDFEGLNARLYRITTDIKWNQAGARNLATVLAKSEWALYFDIDQHLTNAALPAILGNLSNLDSNTLYHLSIKNLWNSIDNVKSEFHPASFLANVERMKEIGMWDEDFAGHYGYEDIYMPLMWDRNGGARLLLSSPYFFEENLDFRSQGLDRSLDRNKQLGLEKINKMNQDQKEIPVRPHSMLRFNYICLKKSSLG